MSYIVRKQEIKTFLSKTLHTPDLVAECIQYLPIRDQFLNMKDSWENVPKSLLCELAMESPPKFVDILRTLSHHKVDQCYTVLREYLKSQPPPNFTTLPNTFIHDLMNIGFHFDDNVRVALTRCTSWCEVQDILGNTEVVCSLTKTSMDDNEYYAQAFLNLLTIFSIYQTIRNSQKRP